MPKKSNRAKGLDLVREVKGILQGLGHRTEGPGYSLAFYNGKMNPIHQDYFACFDLISYDGQQFIGHQVSTEANKSTKIKAIQEAKLPGWVWLRFSDEDRGAGYEVWMVNGDQITESEMTYGIRRKLKSH